MSKSSKHDILEFGLDFPHVTFFLLQENYIFVSFMKFLSAVVLFSIQAQFYEFVLFFVSEL